MPRKTEANASTRKSNLLSPYAVKCETDGMRVKQPMKTTPLVKSVTPFKECTISQSPRLRVISVGSLRERMVMDDGKPQVRFDVQYIYYSRAIGIEKGLFLQKGLSLYNICGMSSEDLKSLGPGKIIDDPVIGSVNVDPMTEGEEFMLRNMINNHLIENRVGPSNIAELVIDFCWFPDQKVRNAVLKRLQKCMISLSNIPHLTEKDMADEFKGLGMPPNEIRRKLQLAYDNTMFEDDEFA